MMTTTNNVCKNEGKGFTFIWKIVNFSHSTVQKGSSFKSPEFNSGSLKGSWYITMYPRGRTDSLVECYLERSYQNPTNTFSLLLCVCTLNGEVLHESVKGSLFYNYNSSGSHSIVKFERNIVEALPEDTLVIHCHIEEDSSAIENPKHCFANTRINLQRRVFHWKVAEFSSLQLRNEKLFNLSEVKEKNSFLSLTLTLVGRNIEDASVQISITFKNLASKTFSTCAIFLVDENGTAKKYMQEEYWLESGDTIKQFPHFLTRNELISSGLPNDTVILRGEVTLSGNNYGLEQVTYGMITREAVTEAFRSTSRHSLEPVTSALSSDMLALYAGSGPPSDFELRVEGHTFPVHQLVLGTRSAVFRAMFDSDMLEQSTKSAELTDMDADTAERLLKFAYADVEPPPGLPWEQLASLYSAADKYQILALRKVCARRLVQVLSAANAPRILQLADQHRDHHLKEDVVDFIFNEEGPFWRLMIGNIPSMRILS